MNENEKTIRKTYSLPSRIVTQERENEFVRTLTYTMCEDGSCELLCVQGNGIQERMVCDPNGITLSRTIRLVDGFVWYHFERTLDENGRIAGERCPTADPCRTEYRYDTTGNVTEKLDYNNKEKLSLRTVIIRDAEGRPIQHTVYDIYGEEIRILTWEYDERGRKTQQTEDDFMEMGSASYTYGENENGSRWECAIIYDGCGGIESRCVEEYDPHDRLTAQTFYKPEGTVVSRSEVTENCEVTLTEAQYRSVRKLCINVLQFYHKTEGYTMNTYPIFTRKSVDFTDVPKAEIACYQWAGEVEYTPKAFAQMIYVEDLGFALHMEAFETDPKADSTAYNQPVYKDSCLECFINFNPAQPNYINFEMNANGAFLSALRPGRKPKTPIHELLSDLPAVKAERFSDRWTVDAFFTLAQIETLFGKSSFALGDKLWGNFYKCGDETPIPHYGMWAPIKNETPDFHRPEFFGTLVIS